MLRFKNEVIALVRAVLSRAINGTAAFFASIGGGFVLVFLHRAFAAVACHSHAFGKIIKGSPVVIVENGKPHLQTMRRNHISEHDLEEDLRLDGQIDDISKVRVARVERSGDISFIKKEG